MTLSAEQLEATFARQRALRDALVEANKAAQPKSSWTSGLLQFGLKSIPADAVRDGIIGIGKALLERRKAAEQDQPVQAKQPPTPKGRPTERDTRARVTFVGTFEDKDEDMPVLPQ